MGITTSKQIQRQKYIHSNSANYNHASVTYKPESILQNNIDTYPIDSIDISRISNICNVEKCIFLKYPSYDKCYLHSLRTSQYLYNQYKLVINESIKKTQESISLEIEKYNASN